MISIQGGILSLNIHVWPRTRSLNASIYLFLHGFKSQREPREAHTAMLQKEMLEANYSGLIFLRNFKSSCVIRKIKLYNKEMWYMNIKQIFGVYFFSQFEHTMILGNHMLVSELGS